MTCAEAEILLHALLDGNSMPGTPTMWKRCGNRPRCAPAACLSRMQQAAGAPLRFGADDLRRRIGGAIGAPRVASRRC
jgi:hypothetical protein